MAKSKRYKTVEEFVEARSGARWDDRETASVIVSEAPEDSDLYDAADEFLIALYKFEDALEHSGYERG